MICYILLICSIILLFYYVYKPKEHFLEKCYKDISNKTSNGNTVFFDNNLINTLYSTNSSNIQHKKDIEILDVLPKLTEYNNSKISSSKKWEDHNDLFTNLKTRGDEIFRNLHKNLDDSNVNIQSKKQLVNNQFKDIQNNVNKFLVQSNNSGIENRLKPTILKTVDLEINKKTIEKTKEMNIPNFMNRTEFNSGSSAYDWQYIEDSNTPVRLNAQTGKLECYSIDNIKCETDYRSKFGNNMIHIDNTKQINCATDSAQLCELNKKFLNRYSDIFDYKSCPEGWTYVAKNICKAPSNFTKNINNKYRDDQSCKTNTCITLNQPIEKLEEYMAKDDIIFKTKINAAAVIKQKVDVDKNITKKINNILGNTDTVAKIDLGNANYFKKGIFAKLYTVKNNNKGNSLRHQLLTSNINFNWSPSNVLGITRKYNTLNNVYIEFIGYLYILKNVNQIILRLGSDSKAILYLSTASDRMDVSKTIDRSTVTTYGKTESNVLTVKPDSYIPFKLVYVDNDLESKLHLEWATGENAKAGSNSYRIISSDNFFINVNECEDSIRMESLNDIVETAPMVKWIDVYAKGTYGLIDNGANWVNEFFKKSKVFKRECLDCNFQFKTIYYKRISEIPDNLSIFNLFNQWNSYSNILNNDFKLYSTYDDLLADRNAWDKCTYDENGVGFPRTCYNSNTGVEIANQWNSLSKPGGQQNFKFSVLAV